MLITLYQLEDWSFPLFLQRQWPTAHHLSTTTAGFSEPAGRSKVDETHVGRWLFMVVLRRDLDCFRKVPLEIATSSEILE